MEISKPVLTRDGKWKVKTPNGTKVFSDGETAEDFYLLNKNRQDGKSSSS